MGLEQWCIRSVVPDMSGENRRNCNLQQFLKNVGFSFPFFPFKNAVCCLYFLSVICESRDGEMAGKDVQMFLKPIVLNLEGNVYYLLPYMTCCCFSINWGTVGDLQALSVGAESPWFLCSAVSRESWALLETNKDNEHHLCINRRNNFLPGWKKPFQDCWNIGFCIEHLSLYFSLFLDCL